MSNTHVLPDRTYEVQAIFGDLLSPAILSTTLAAPVPPSLTLPAFTTAGYVRSGTPTQLVYVNQPAAAVTLAGSNGAYWLALHKDTHTPVAGWTRQAGSHYLWQANATQPADPPGGLVLAGVTVAGGVISAVTPGVNYPATKVAYGGATGGLAFDEGLTYNDSTNALTLKGTAEAHRFLVLERAGDNVMAFHTNLSAGTGRYAVGAFGTAPSTLGGTLYVQDAVSFGNPGQTRVNLGLGNLATLNSPLPVGNGGTGAGDAATARANLGVGNVGTQNAPLPIAYGGTQAGDAGNARANLGIGSMGTQNANAVAISGGTANLASGSIGLLSVNGGVVGGYQLTVTGPAYFSTTVQVQGALNTAGAATITGVLGVGAVNPGGYTAYIQGNCRIVSDLLVNTQAYKPGGGPWTDSSSRAIKGHIAPITGALGLLLAQRGRTFEYTEPTRRALLPGPQYGFIYDEVTLPQWKGEDSTLCPRGVEALLVEALRELATRLEALERPA